MTSAPPAPSGQVLSLVSALWFPENHELHSAAIHARDQALAVSNDSYSHFLLQLAYLLAATASCSIDAGTGNNDVLAGVDPQELLQWKQSHPKTVHQLEQSPEMWIPFGQTAGYILKNALLHPPVVGMSVYTIEPHQIAPLLQQTLLYTLNSPHAALRAVASTVIATVAVSPDALQPALSLQAWKGLVPTLMNHLRQPNSPQGSLPVGSASSEYAARHGSLQTIQKMLEDGYDEWTIGDLDEVVPVLLKYLASPSDVCCLSALQSLVVCLGDGSYSRSSIPSALVAGFDAYLQALSALTTHANPTIRQWVCRSLVTILQVRSEFLKAHFEPICRFMLQACNVSQLQNNTSELQVALEATEFWLAVSHLSDEAATQGYHDVVRTVLPQLVPTLLRNMIYSSEQQAELLAENAREASAEAQQLQGQESLKPIFHKSRAQHVGQQNDHSKPDDDSIESGSDGDDDDDDNDDQDGNEWTLRKCSAASLDSLASLFGGEPLLPHLLPCLEQGLNSNASDPWAQEASILALGAIAEGCEEEMSQYLPRLHPYLLTILATPESPASLPQLKSIAAWTVGRYAGWAVEQVQTGAQGHLLATMTETFLRRLGDRNRRVQVACVSAFGVIVENFGDLMAPYLEPTFQAIVVALGWYQGKSLMVLFDTLGIVADYCGPAIAEGNLPGVVIPPLLHMWNEAAKKDPANRMLLSLMEALASISMASAVNFQPFALEAFEMAMATIEAVTLDLATSGEVIKNEEDTDPIICATDLLDGLVEGLGSNFGPLVTGSQRYGQHFLSALLAMCSHEISGVRMSALALLGDLARNTPSLIAPALPRLLKEATLSMDPIQPSVCANAIWAIGEICVRCEGNPKILEPFAPAILQNLIAILMGNGTEGRGGRGSEIPSLVENASACTGRLAKVDPRFVASDLPRFLLGWCDGMAKVTDPIERRDAFQGFIQALYVNPKAIEESGTSVSDAIASIVFAIITWHMPPELPEESTALLHGDYEFRPFPAAESELAASIRKLLVDIKASAGEETWHKVQKELPVNVRRLFREAYSL